MLLLSSFYKTMDEVKIIEIKKSVFAENDKDAAALRQELKAKGVFLLFFVASFFHGFLFLGVWV